MLEIVHLYQWRNSRTGGKVLRFVRWNCKDSLSPISSWQHQLILLQRKSCLFGSLINLSKWKCSDGLNSILFNMKCQYESIFIVYEVNLFQIILYIIEHMYIIYIFIYISFICMYKCMVRFGNIQIDFILLICVIVILFMSLMVWIKSLLLNFELRLIWLTVLK